MKDVIWVNDRILEDLRDFPDDARQTIGHALSEAQDGRLSADAKPFKGYKEGVFEIVATQDGNVYRAFYAVKIGNDIYALHAFQKKSPRGSETPKPDLETLEARLKRAKEIAIERREAAKAAIAAKKGARR